MSADRDDLAARLAALSPEKRALLTRRLAGRSPSPSTSPSPTGVEPIAVIGMACRFPGADGLDAFWTLIRDGGDAVTEVPADRWDVHDWYDKDPSAAGKIATRWGGFLSNVDKFDAAFFGISPKEAVRMDPQQRLLLEVGWDALEHAGQTFETLAGSPTGVFVGVHSHSTDYATLQFGDRSDLDSFTAVGTAHSVLAGRLSYWLDLKGPSLAIDTACSSSLVAVHYACQALRTREASLALAAGVNLMLAPDFSVAASRMHMLSPEGRCKAFDAAADGFVRGEGAGVVVLKRLADAQAAGDRVLAIIRGSAVNQDGRTNGITAPNASSQKAVLAQALASAGVTPDSVTLIEAHGTGTPLGDPIEIEALVDVVGGKSAMGPCAVGSVKANVGHLEGAAGVAGLIKTVLCLQHGRTPPLVHLKTINPHINLAGSRLTFPATGEAWSGVAPRVAGVSSFGFSGTNAHVVLQAAAADDRHDLPAGGQALLVPVSARSPEALTAMVASYAEWLSHQDVGVRLEDVAASASRREHHPWRAGFVAGSVDDLRALLLQWSGGADVSAGASAAGGIVFVFPGQGAQAPGMGSHLMADPVFAGAIREIDVALRAEVDWSLLDVITGVPAAEPLLARIDVIQPALFAIGVALARLWQSLGVVPDAVVGHSMGEVAAAHVAGGLSLEDAVRTICRRSRLLTRVSGRGAMAFVELPFADAERLCATTDGVVSVAASNSTRSSVVAGDAAAIDILIEQLTASGVFCRRIKVDVASHSAQVDELLPALREGLADLKPRTPLVPFASTVIRTPLSESPVLDAAYWVDNLRQPVRFADTVRALLHAGHCRFIEMSPHPTLVTGLEELLEDVRDEDSNGSAGQAVAVGSLHRDQPDRVAILASAATLYRHGVDLNWPAINPPGHRVDLPRYPWQRQSYWIARPRASRPVRSRPVSWTHGLEWRPMSAGRPDPVPAATRWCIVGDAPGEARALTALIEASGGHAWTSDPARDGASAMRQADAILDLRAIGRSPADDDAGAAARVALLCRDLAARDWQGRLFVATRGALALAGSSADPAQAAVWGLGRVIALEEPERWGGLIDIDPDADVDRAARMLWDALRDAGDEDQIAWRGRQRYVPRLVPRVVADVDTVTFEREGTYLITGGLGYLGLALAEWMARHGAGHVLLVSRRVWDRDRPDASDPPGSDRIRAAVRRIEASGAMVTVVAADAADEPAMAGLLDRCGREWPVLRGIMHLAGVLELKAARDIELVDLQRAMRPKLAAARVLDSLSRRHAIDFFVGFGSGAGVWGSRHAGAYAAANAALDALAEQRTRESLPALVVDWGWWAEGNTDAALDRLFAESGLRAMPVDAAFDLLGALIGTKASRRIVVDVDWARFRQIYAARRRRPILDVVAAPAEPAVVESPAADGVAELRAASAERRRAMLTDWVRDAAAQTLGLAPGSPVAPETGFFKLGMDSLMTVQLRSRLGRRLGRELPSTVAFEYPTVHALAGYLAATLFPDAVPSSTVGPGQALAPAPELATATEDDLAALLDEAIARSERRPEER